MSESTPNLRFMSLIYCIGLVLILTGCYILLPSDLGTEIAVLDAIVAMIVFTLNFPIAAFGWFDRAIFERRMLSMTVVGFFSALYSIFAVVGMIYMGFHNVIFKHQVFYHLVAAFLMMFAFGLAILTGIQADKVAVEETTRKSGVKELLANARKVDDLLTRQGAELFQERATMKKFLEDIRFLSPTLGAREADLEIKMNIEILAIEIIVANFSQSQNKEELNAKLLECTALMTLRRNPNTRQGES